MTTKRTLLILFLFLVVFFGAHLLGAQAIYIEAGIPGQVSTGATDSSNVTPAKYVSYIYIFMIGLVGIAGFASLVFYGIVWMYSGVSEKKAEAMEGIKNTFVGIILALSAFIILNTINPNLVSLKDPSFSLNLVKDTGGEYAPIEILGYRIPGYYHFSYKDKIAGPKGAPIYRYSTPFESSDECEVGRDTYLTAGFSEVHTCSGYAITENFFYVTYNFAASGTTKKVSGFTNVSACVSAAAAAQTATMGVNPDSSYRVGCYDDDKTFYDSSLTAEAPTPTAVYDWCFTATNAISGDVFPTCRTSRSGCVATRAPFAARPALFTAISSCAQVK